MVSVPRRGIAQLLKANIMAKRTSTVKKTISLVKGTIGTLDNLASVSENLTGMLADGTVHFRAKTPTIIESFLDKRRTRKAKETELDELEIENELLELTIKNQELKSKIEDEPSDKAE